MSIERVLPPPFGPDDENYREHLARYEFTAPLVAGMNVLDVACGTGFGSAALSGGARRVTGIDLSKGAISFARDHYGQGNIDFVQGDAVQLPFPDQCFDAVVSFETIEHLPDQEKFLDEIRRVLKPGGQLIISTPDKEVIGQFFIEEYQNPFHIKELSRGEFDSLLGRHFSKVEVYGQGLFAAPSRGRYLRPLLRAAKPIAIKLMPAGLAAKLKSAALGTGASGSIVKLLPHQQSKYLIAVCR